MSIVSSIVGEVLKLHGVAAYAVIRRLGFPRRRCWRDGTALAAAAVRLVRRDA